MRRMSAPADTLQTGQAALARGAWPEARAAFEAVLAAGESAEAHEGLGWALWWLDDPPASFAARETAYRLYVRDARPRDAARVATFLAVDIYDYQGNAVASGWLERARRHLEGLPRSAEHGWFALWDGHFARFARGDLETSRRLGREAFEIARALGLRDLELLAIGLEGHALVSEGQVDEGMRRLDEATAAALSGEISDLDAAGAACCFLMHACEQVRDYDRATQWAERVAEFSRRWSIRPLFAICRVHYAAVLTGRGEWAAAEQELERSLSELGAARGPARSEAVLFLGELRRRQGRFDQALALFEEVEGMSLALYGRAAIAADRGDPAAAVALLERALRRVAQDNWTVRSTILDLLTRTHIAIGREDEATRALETLQSIADLVRTHHARAMARHAAGLWMQWHGEPEAARHAIEDAVDLFRDAQAPYESNRARLDLAELLRVAGHEDEARREAAAARDAFVALGAEVDAQRAAALAAPAAGAAGGEPRAKDAGPLTRREAEVIGLVAEGLGDKEIADRLSLSEHTVHRHVSNAMLKLEVPSRAAAVARAMRLGLI
jgi:ATP/maltotriose-dependent transcriptional regulator MalT